MVLPKISVGNQNALTETTTAMIVDAMGNDSSTVVRNGCKRNCKRNRTRKTIKMMGKRQDETTASYGQSHKQSYSRLRRSSGISYTTEKLLLRKTRLEESIAAMKNGTAENKNRTASNGQCENRIQENFVKSTYDSFLPPISSFKGTNLVSNTTDAYEARHENNMPKDSPVGSLISLIWTPLTSCKNFHINRW